MKKSKDINIPITPEESIEEEQMIITQTVPLNSLLIYIVDGIIPLITTLCKQFASHEELCKQFASHEEYRTLLTQRHDVLKSIGDSIAVSICSIIFSGVSQYVHIYLECPEKWWSLLIKSGCIIIIIMYMCI